MTEPEDLRQFMPLLEHPRADSDLDDATAARLVAFAAQPPWSDHWASHALNWVDEGVWSDAVAQSLQVVSQDKSYSQRTRHRAWRYVKPRRG